jgi:hypothetical protein
MANNLSPAKIVKLWKRVNDRFGPEEGDKKDKKKKPSAKEKLAEKEGERIDKGLVRLREAGKKDLKEPAAAAKFQKVQGKAVKSLQKYCKLLKGNDLKESVQDITKFRKLVKQITIVVEGLETGPFTDDEGEVDLNAISDVDTSKLDAALEDPNFGEFSDEELEGDEDEAADEAVPQAPPKPGAKPEPDGSAQFTTRLKTLMPAIQQAQAQGGQGAQDIKVAVSEANMAARKKDFTQANSLLDRAEALLKQMPKGPTVPPSTGEKPSTPEAPVSNQPLPDAVRKELVAAIQAWQGAMASIDSQIAQLAAALKKTGDEDLMDIGDKGVNALTGNHKVRLMAILREVASGQPEVQRRTAAKGLPLVAKFRQHIESDERVAVCDANPFNVTVTIRKTLGDSLGQLEKAFQQVTRA